jgi:hypothetical protein
MYLRRRVKLSGRPGYLLPAELSPPTSNLDSSVLILFPTANIKLHTQLYYDMPLCFVIAHASGDDRPPIGTGISAAELKMPKNARTNNMAPQPIEE